MLHAHREVSRVEGFSDAVFAFAVTLLVVSLEVPHTFDELRLAMRQFFAFAICFALLFQVWWRHFNFFRRYGLEDAPTIVLTGVLLFVVLFNHQAERASYLIAFTGIAIWFAAEPSENWRTALFGIAMLTIPIMSTLVPGAWLRTPTVMTYRLALPSFVIWLALQRELLRRAEPESARLPRRSDQLRVELDLNVALERR